ncbi:MAG: hypothetical protein ACRC62_25855, partial [Microcoleus sp.]
LHDNSMMISNQFYCRGGAPVPAPAWGNGGKIAPTDIFNGIVGAVPPCPPRPGETGGRIAPTYIFGSIALIPSSLFLVKKVRSPFTK